LPHAGWPNAFARARVDANSKAGAGWLLRIDPARAVPKELAPEGLTRALAYVTVAPASPKGIADVPGDVVLYVRHVGGLRRLAIGVPPPNTPALLRGRALDDPAALSGNVLAIDGEGFLLYAEADQGQERGLIQQLVAAGLTQAMILPAGARLSLMTDTGAAAVSGEAVAAPDPVLGAALALIAETRPPADVMFPDVEPKPYRFWGWLQGQRVRYFPTGEPRFKQPEEADPAAPGTPPADGPPKSPNADSSAPKPRP
jgi:hypothetical protein